MKIERYLERILPDYPVHVRYTVNRCTMISCRRDRSSGVLRLHQIFEDAPDPIAEAVAELFFNNPRRQDRRAFQGRINDFINENERTIVRTSRPPRLFEALPGAQGSHHDLQPYFDRLNRRFFGGELRLHLTWSDRPYRRTMGTWKETLPGQPNLITINRLLDDPRVPEYYLDVLLYHEMLHEVIAPVVQDGKKVRHTASFRRRERLHEQFERAERWGDANLERMFWEWRQRNRRRHHRRR
jgi:SprT-like family protein